MEIDDPQTRPVDGTQAVAIIAPTSSLVIYRVGVYKSENSTAAFNKGFF